MVPAGCVDRGRVAGFGALSRRIRSLYDRGIITTLLGKRRVTADVKERDRRRLSRLARTEPALFQKLRRLVLFAAALSAIAVPCAGWGWDDGVQSVPAQPGAAASAQ